MLSIRNGCFETNSSSVHALVVADAMPDAQTPLTVAVYPGEYGWGVETLDTPNERASYLYTAMCCYNCCQGREEDPLDTLSCLLGPWGVTVICAIPPIFKSSNTSGRHYVYLDNGYIDHGNEVCGFVKAVMKDPSLAFRFIFSDDSRAVIYNDNMDTEEFEAAHSLIPDASHTIFWKGN